MSIRVWASTWAQAGTAEEPAYIATAEKYCTGGYNVFWPVSANAPASPWVIVIGRAANWTAAAADAGLTDLLGGDLPGGVDTVPEFRALLRNTTVGKLPLARRNAISAALDKIGVIRSDFTASTTMAKVWQRIRSTLDEKDDNYAMTFGF